MFAEHPHLSVTTNASFSSPRQFLLFHSSLPSECVLLPLIHGCCAFSGQWWAVHMGKKKTKYASTGLQQTFFFFFFLALHDRGRKWNTGMGGKKSGLAFLFFLLMMLLCTIVASTCCLFPAVCCSLNLAAVILAYFCGHGCSQALRCNYHCCRVEKGGGIFPEHFLFIHFLFFCVAPCAAV